ncbi:MAG: M24 family metallopeptidase [Actinomycetota bacterium]
MSEILQRARMKMAERALDVVVASSPENVAYLGGIAPPSQRIVRSRHAFFVLPMEGPTYYVVIELEAGVVRERARADEFRVYQEFVEDPVDVVAEVLRELDLLEESVGLETTHLSSRDVDRFRSMLPGGSIVEVDELLLGLRLRKTKDEIATIRRIAEVAEGAAHQVAGEFEPGASERALGNRITELYSDGGGDALTMLVVGSGPRSAEPNAPPTARPITAGEVIRIDVIGTKDNYYSDVARTVVAGEPTDEHKNIWRILRDVRDRAIDALRPGALTSDVFRLYGDAMEEAGLPSYHFLGHGLGVTLHEEPFLSSLHDTRLEPGMVMCVEPMCLIPGRFGLQLEDEVLITSDGAEPLTNGGPLLRLGG